MSHSIQNPYRFGSNSGLLTDLVAWWELNETSGNRADSHASFDLTDNNTVLSTTGVVGNAATFVSANSEYLSRASNDVLTGTGAKTIAFWFNTSVAATTNILFMMGGVLTGTAIQFSVETSGVFWLRCSGNTRSWSSGLADGNWHLAIIEFPASTQVSGVTLTLDNSLATPASTSGTTTLNTGSTTFNIGAYQPGSSYSSSSIDLFGIWSNTLTSDQKTLLFNSGAGRAYAEL